MEEVIPAASDGAGDCEASACDDKAEAENVAARAKYDKYWSQFKVDDERVQLGQPVNEGTIRSLVLWTRKPDGDDGDNQCLNREAQRLLKKDKKSKDKEKEVNQEQEMEKAGEQDPDKDNNTRAKPKAKAKAKAKGKAKAKAAAKTKAKAKAKGKARAKPDVSQLDTSPADDEDESSSLDLSDVVGDDFAQAPASTTPSPAEEEIPTKDKADELEQDAPLHPPKKRRRRAGDDGHVPSFARRICPKTSKPAAQWRAIKDAFNSIIRGRVAFPSSHEEFWLQG